MNIAGQKILKDREVEKFLTRDDYSSATEILFKSQLNSWEAMKSNYEALKSIQTKSYLFNGFKIKVQFNPGRIKSTSADVEESSIKNRKCFLCLENLPEEQKGILFPGDFILLSNPFPIFNQHFTISSLNHQRQKIFENFESFLEISKLLSTKLTLIYNGPECGASAPDHLHFQAGTKLAMPIENDIQQLKNDFGKVIKKDKVISVSLIDDGLRKIIFIETADKLKLIKTFNSVCKFYKAVSGSKSEPMMNILSTYDSETGWDLILFLRSRHRPDIFYKEEPEKLVVSPAAVDLGGLLITPRKKDFKKLNKKLIQNIFKEVSLSDRLYSELKVRLTDWLNG
jgi:hypothetical protein